jgi:hypothetical protein
MKRIAIILGSPLSKNHPDHLRFVVKDVENYKRFLLSSTGGAWREDEIKTGWNIAANKVSIIQNLCKDADLALIIYTGHGGRIHGKDYLNTNDTEILWLSQLITSAKRQITIVDSCRVDYPWLQDTGIYGFGIYFDNTRPDIARMLYDYYINQSAFGHVTLHSSSGGQLSYADSQDGSKFTFSLLEEMRRWGFNESHECLSVKSALRKSASYLKSLNTDQKPQYTFNNESALSFPFAVSPTAYLKRINASALDTKSISIVNSDSGFGKFVVGLGIILAIGTIISNLGEDD